MNFRVDRFSKSLQSDRSFDNPLPSYTSTFQDVAQRIWIDHERKFAWFDFF